MRAIWGLVLMKGAGSEPAKFVEKINFDTEGIRILIWIPIQLKAFIEVCIK
jgi:hypothetical protein